MGAEVDFNALQFEKKLTNLKDSQDSINATCSWCLEHKQHHKRIVTTWLSVLKRVKVEQRLTLFYLANDVIQYSKRKSFDFVESWGTALQKATTLVRDVKVKHKILRIFKIWEQRGVYGEEFISDLSGLISVTPSTKKVDDNVDFPSAHLANKIRICTKLDNETDRKLQLFKQHNPQLQDGEALMASLKDRAHVDDVEKEMDEYVKHLESYIEALRTEIKARNSFIHLLTATGTQLEKDRKDVKVVASAYRSFATRVKNFRKKLEEKKTSLNSPIPSPDINAPSPSPDSELDMPELNVQTYHNAGFYQPPNTGHGTFMNNGGFSSFLGSGVNFTLNSDVVDASKTQSPQISNFFANVSEPPPPPAPVPAPPPAAANYNNYNNNQMPLAPPPLPPFTNEAYSDYSGGSSYGNNGNYTEQVNDSYQSFNSDYTQSLNETYTNNAPQAGVQAPYNAYKCDEYNPEEDVETWNTSEWAADAVNALQTPASPPAMEKEAFLAPIEYHEEASIAGAVDVDHRLLLCTPDKKDIDHRNLISLTGSPKDESTEKRSEWRSSVHSFPARRKSEFRDNNESIDMDLSDDEATKTESRTLDDNAPVVTVAKKGLLPPPPFPANMDANSFLEELDEAQYDELNAEGTTFDAPWRRAAKPPLLADRPARHPGRMNHMCSSRGEFNSRGGGDFREPNMLRPRFRGVVGKFPPRGNWSRGGGVRGGRAFGAHFHKHF